MVFFGSQTPIPTPSMTVDPDAVTPGPAGFGVIVLLVLVLVALIWDMNRRVRRVRYRDEVRAELDAEQAAVGTASDAPSDPTMSEERGGQAPPA